MWKWRLIGHPLKVTIARASPPHPMPCNNNIKHCYYCDCCYHGNSSHLWRAYLEPNAVLNIWHDWNHLIIMIILRVGATLTYSWANSLRVVNWPIQSCAEQQQRQGQSRACSGWMRVREEQRGKILHDQKWSFLGLKLPPVPQEWELSLLPGSLFIWSLPKKSICAWRDEAWLLWGAGQTVQ